MMQSIGYTVFNNYQFYKVLNVSNWKIIAYMQVKKAMVQFKNVFATHIVSDVQ